MAIIDEKPTEFPQQKIIEIEALRSEGHSR